MKQNLRILPVLLLATACVSSKRFHALEEDHNKTVQDFNKTREDFNKTKQDLTVSEARTADLESKLGVSSADKSRLETSVKEMNQAMADLNRRRQETEKRMGEFRDLTTKFKSLVDAGKLSVKIVNGRMIVALSTDIIFAPGSSKLSPEGETAVKEVTGLLTSIPDKKFQVEGHTDNVPIKTSVYPSNWELASARAINVLKDMVEAGMPPERISAASFGDTQPVKPNDSDEGKRANRRINIVIVPDLSSLPGFDELQRYSSGG